MKAAKRLHKLHPPSPTRILDINEQEEVAQCHDHGQKKEEEQEEEKAEEEPEMEQEEIGEKLDSIIDD